jgi:hypothetical protein
VSTAQATEQATAEAPAAEATTTPPTEAAPEAPPEKPAEPPADERLAKALSRLTRDREAFNNERKTWEQQREAERQKVQRWLEVEQKYEQDPVAVLEALGPEAGAKLLARLMEAQAEDEDPTARRIKELEARLEADRKEREERERQVEDARIERQLQKAQEDLRRTGETNRERYYLTNLAEERGFAVKLDADTKVSPFDLAWRIVEGHYQQTREVLSWDRALDAVEEHLGTLMGELRPKQQQPEPSRAPAPRAEMGTTTTLNPRSAPTDGPAVLSQRPSTQEQRMRKVAALLERFG